MTTETAAAYPLTRLGARVSLVRLPSVGYHVNRWMLAP